MKEFTYIIKDPVGIHARPAGILAKAAKALGDTTVYVAKGDNKVKASQLMKLMGLGVKQDDEITISVEGGDEEAAFAAMKEFFEKNL